MKVYFCSNPGTSVLVTNHVPDINIRGSSLYFECEPPHDEHTANNRYVNVPKYMLPSIPVGKIVVLDV